MDGWVTGLGDWLQGVIEAHPAWDRWLERLLHAHGLHGPGARHLLKTRVVPAAALLLTAAILLVVLLFVRRARRGPPLRHPDPRVLTRS